MRADNTPQNALKTVPGEKVRVIVTDLLQLHEMGKPETDREVEARISQYFELCRETSIRPGVESLAAALHIDRTTLWRWEQGEGCSQRRTEAVQGAKGMISAFIEQAALQGQINPVTSIFLMKNWMRYQDNYSFEGSPQPLRFAPSMSPEEIAARIEQDIPLDDDATIETVF